MYDDCNNVYENDSLTIAIVYMNTYWTLNNSLNLYTCNAIIQLGKEQNDTQTVQMTLQGKTFRHDVINN